MTWAADLLAEIRETSPNTLFEVLLTIVLLLLGIVVLLNPDQIAFIKGIDQDPFLESMNGLQGIGLIIASGVPILGTGYFRSVA
jgi:hypothetical protein